MILKKWKFWKQFYAWMKQGSGHIPKGSTARHLLMLTNETKMATSVLFTDFDWNEAKKLYVNNDISRTSRKMKQAMNINCFGRWNIGSYWRQKEGKELHKPWRTFWVEAPRCLRYIATWTVPCRQTATWSVVDNKAI